MTVRVQISCILFNDILHVGVNNQLNTLLTSDSDVAMFNTLSNILIISASIYLYSNDSIC